MRGSSSMIDRSKCFSRGKVDPIAPIKMNPKSTAVVINRLAAVLILTFEAAQMRLD
jgi:hypothetical protein